MSKQKREPIDPGPLARPLRAALGVYLAGEMVMALISAWEIGRVMNGAPETSDQASMWIGLAALAYLAAFLVAAFLTLKWTYRVNLNASRLASGKTISPAWAVGWHFVPFANLVMPFRAMRETWQISHSPQGWRDMPTPSLLHWWWGLFLLVNILSTASTRLELTAYEDSGALMLSEELAIVSSLLAIPLVLVLRRIVERLTQAQVHALSLQAFDEPAIG
jgi:hypothetical protein